MRRDVMSASPFAWKVALTIVEWRFCLSICRHGEHRSALPTSVAAVLVFGGSAVPVLPYAQPFPSHLVLTATLKGSTLLVRLPVFDCLVFRFFSIVFPSLPFLSLPFPSCWLFLAFPICNLRVGGYLQERSVDIQDAVVHYAHSLYCPIERREPQL